LAGQVHGQGARNYECYVAGIRLGLPPPRRVTGWDAAVADAGCSIAAGGTGSVAGGLGSAADRRPKPISLANVERRIE